MENSRKQMLTSDIQVNGGDKGDIDVALGYDMELSLTGLRPEKSYFAWENDTIETEAEQSEVKKEATPVNLMNDTGCYEQMNWATSVQVRNSDY